MVKYWLHDFKKAWLPVIQIIQLEKAWWIVWNCLKQIFLLLCLSEMKYIALTWDRSKEQSQAPKINFPQNMAKNSVCFSDLFSENEIQNFWIWYLLANTCCVAIWNGSASAPQLNTYLISCPFLNRWTVLLISILSHVSFNKTENRRIADLPGQIQQSFPMCIKLEQAG